MEPAPFSGPPCLFHGGPYLRFDFQAGKVDKTAKTGVNGWWQVATI